MPPWGWCSPSRARWRAEDEPDALYGLAARAVQISSDGLTYRFLMRPGITSHDGSPLTAHDVAFLLKILKDKGHPIAQQSLRDFVGAGTVVVRFTTQRARDVPLFAASLPIFSRAYYSKRPFEETTLEVPLGSGPYKVGRFEPGRPAGRARVEQFRYPALRILPRSRSCLRRVHGQKLSVPGRIYIADLGDTLRLSCSSGRSRQARCDCRQYAIGRKAGSSTRDGTDSRTSACARPSSMHSISNGPTRTSCTGPMKGRISCATHAASQTRWYDQEKAAKVYQ
jgi:hypothetical protein